MIYTLDRIEGSFAVLINENESIDVELEKIEENARHEGAKLRKAHGGFEACEAVENEKRRGLAERTARLMKKRGGEK